MRALVLIAALVLGSGCATDAQDPVPTPTPTIGDVAERGAEMADSKVDAVDVCDLAAALPTDDICHFICDPSALADQLIADGSPTGNCYQLYCQVSETQHVIGGVCLVP